MKTTREILTEAGLDQKHWGKRIIAAEKRGAFSQKERRDATGWTTCACGKQDPRLHDNDGFPTDQQLDNLALEFCYAVCGKHEPWGIEEAPSAIKAARTLIAIEKRAEFLLNEMEAKK